MSSSPAFDLEKALAAWRRSLHWHPSLSKEDQEELEEHIRDHVDALMLEGYTEAAAFREAIREMGPGHITEHEYRKNLSWRRTLEVILPMLRNYFTLAYRNLKKNKASSVINIVGLSIAIAVCIVVYLFLRDYRAIDQFHENGEHIFLIEHTRELGHEERRQGWSPAPLGPALEADFPQVEGMVRIAYRRAQVYHAEHAFSETISFTDPSFLSMFTFPLKSGTASALTDPRAVVLSEQTALKYFGTEDPIGQSLTFTFNDSLEETFVVQGVAQAFPRSAGFGFHFLINIAQLEHLGLARLDAWDTSMSATFVQLHEPGDAQNLAGQMGPYVLLQNLAEAEQPVKSFYFDNLRDPLPGAHTVIRRFLNTPSPYEIFGFLGIALAMLALSCFNYVNIALGSAARRLKEIGMRKVMGGRRWELIVQFLAENVALCLIALLLGIVVAQYLLIPALGLIPNADLSEHLVFSWTESAELYLFLLGLLMFVGLISGAYPAFYISSFAPTVVFKGKQKFANKKGLTYTFITLQFVLTFVTVMFSTLGASLKIYQKNIDWGYNPDQTVLVELGEDHHYALFHEAILQHPNITHVEGAVEPIGLTERRADVKVGAVRFRPIRYRVGPTYMKSLGLRVQSGRLFDAQLHAAAEMAVVVNETFVREHGWDEPLGQVVQVEGTDHTVIGVVDDFVERGAASVFLQESTVFQRVDAAYTFASIQVKEGTRNQTTAALEATWERLFPDQPFHHIYQTDVHAREEYELGAALNMLFALSGVALLIACMGLFGLASQNSVWRLKEIGIRKVLGASLTRLIVKVNRSFIVLLTVAAGIATTGLYAGILMLEKALEVALPFAGPVPFLAAYLLVLGTAALAVALQTYALVTVNPAAVLRNE